MRLRVVSVLLLGSYLALLLLVMLWHGILFPPRQGSTALVLAIVGIPLALPLPGLLRGSPRSHIWASLLVLLYLLHGAGEAVANPPERWLGLLEILLSLSVFCSALLFVRWQGHGEPKLADH